VRSGQSRVREVFVMQLDVTSSHPFAERARQARKGPIDHAHLGRYTMGNRALEVEVLELFAGQAPLTLADLRRADTAKAWHIAAHTLKGSARAVGAFEVADLAALAEAAGYPSDQRAMLLQRLEASLETTCDYIGSLACVA